VGQCVAVDQVGNGFVGAVPPPASTSPPSISGTATQGQTLTEADGSYTGSPTGFSYQWQDCDSAGNACTAIPGATGQSYTLTGSDAGHTIRVQETASNIGGAGGPASSNATAVVLPLAPANTSPPSISGSAVQGQKLSEAHGSYINNPTSYAYQWQRCDSAGNGCAAIPGASGQSYTLTGADVGHTIRVRETASNAGGTSDPVTSKQTALVSPNRAPVVSRYRVTNNTFVVAGGQKKTKLKSKQGTAFKYTLSEPATVKLVIAERLPGRHQGKRCLAPTRKLRKAKSCTRTITIGTLTRTSHQGADTLAFTGRIGSKALKPARYQATLTATDAAKRTSKAQRIFFTIVVR
ncbi:MAG: hypothetical protein M3070_03775, partial [Actinomycetota bacterium]|nr:hypothetical protein [Actinomycetota bacterium]